MQPGVYNLTSEHITLIQALALARGLSPGADAKSVVVKRKDGEKINIDLKAILMGKTPDINLNAGDEVRVS
jgi:protein involved in polysaccharide export with SLBB domain